ncbi:MAG TPA: class II aldolase/adducin family protein [Solirubrobacteraceae bacterium]|nr:class II aldolase/adducin family protein [Solirubrobacteraceae bacterium]
MLEIERDQVAEAGRRLAAAGLVLGTAGNVSARAGELVVVTPTGAVLERLTAEQVAVVDLDGMLVEGELAPTSELELHLGIYRRYNAGAVVHAHSPIATAIACVLEELPLVHYQMLALGGPVRVARYATFGTPELAQLTLDALQDRTAALMANHGMIAFGPDLDAAMENTRLVEWAAELYWRAAAFGRPRTLDDTDVQALIEAVTTRGYGSMQEAGR